MGQLDQLLGQRTGSLIRMARTQISPERTEDPIEVNAGVFIKTCILGGEKGLDKMGLSVADWPIFAPNPDDSGSGGEAGLAGHEARGQNEATESTSPQGGRMPTWMPALGTLPEVRPRPRGRQGAGLLGARGLRPRQRQELRGGHPKLDMHLRVGCRELP